MNASPAARRRIRVLHTIRSLRVDGVVKVVLRHLAERDDDGFEHHVCALRDEDELAGEFRAIGIEPVFLGHAGPATTLRTLMRLHRLLGERRIDVVHCNRTADLALAGLVARLRGIPVMSTLHWLGRLDEHPEDAGKAWLARWLEMHATVALNRAFATRIVAVSGAVKTSFASLPGFPERRVHVAYPGLSMKAPSLPVDEREALATVLGLAGKSPVLLNVGRLHAVKGQLQLVSMMARVRQRLPRAHLLVAGEGDLRPALERAIATANLGDAITLLGTRADVDMLLALSDALVLSSESEAAPLPLLEAMRAGRPVVATLVGGVAEMVEDGMTGLLVPRGDVDALAAAVLRLFAEPGLAARMGASARKRGEERFDAPVPVRALDDHYRALVAGEAG